MKAVSNSSVLIALSSIGQLELINQRFSECKKLLGFLASTQPTLQEKRHRNQPKMRVY